jgi:hypothetical protein
MGATLMPSEQGPDGKGGVLITGTFRVDRVGGSGGYARRRR